VGPWYRIVPEKFDAVAMSHNVSAECESDGNDARLRLILILACYRRQSRDRFQIRSARGFRCVLSGAVLSSLVDLIGEKLIHVLLFRMDEREYVNSTNF
jgi:hypothetical protein